MFLKNAQKKNAQTVELICSLSGFGLNDGDLTTKLVEYSVTADTPKTRKIDGEKSSLWS